MEFVDKRSSVYRSTTRTERASMRVRSAGSRLRTWATSGAVMLGRGVRSLLSVRVRVVPSPRSLALEFAVGPYVVTLGGHVHKEDRS